MPIITPTKQEHLRRLRTTQQPTIVVEGKDDLLLLHKILDQSNLTTQNILVAGDCLMVQELYTEVAANQTVYPYVKQFFTDLDMRIFTGVPTETDLIFYTKGYSIENDLFADSEDFIDNLFGYANYATDKATVVETVTDWFAFEVEDYMKNPAKITNFKACKLRNPTIFDTQNCCFTPSFLSNRSYYAPATTYKNDLKENYTLKLRGHTLFEMIGLLNDLRKKYTLNYTNVRHGNTLPMTTTFPSYNDSQILEMCFAHAKGKQQGYLTRVINRIKTSFHQCN